MRFLIKGVLTISLLSAIVSGCTTSEQKKNNDTKLDDRSQIILEPHDDLLALEEEITTYMAKKKGNGVSKAQDWIGDKAVLNDYIIKNKIRHNHFNFSSKEKPGYSPNIEDGKRTRYVFKA